MKKPKVSVVATSLRDREFDNLRKDLKKQTFKNFEFVPVIGDFNIAKGWNIGVSKAKGDIILITESDVSLPSDWIEKMVENVQKNGGFALGSQVITTSREFDAGSIGVYSKIAKKLPFNEKYLCAETEWFERIKKEGFEIKREKIPVVYHKKKLRSIKTLKMSFVHAANHARIAIKYWGKNADLNVKRVIFSRLYHLAKEILSLLGMIYGFITFWKS